MLLKQPLKHMNMQYTVNSCLNIAVWQSSLSKNTNSAYHCIPPYNFLKKKIPKASAHKFAV